MPKMFLCYEFYGSGDRYFGGAADDRALGRDGAFLTRAHTDRDVAWFATKAEALKAGERATNRRAGGTLGSFDLEVR